MGGAPDVLNAPNGLGVALALLFVVALLRGWRRGAVLPIGGFAGPALGLFVGAWAAARIAGLVVSGPGPGAVCRLAKAARNSSLSKKSGGY